MTYYKPFSFLMGISMGKWPDFEYHVGKWLKYDRSGYNTSQVEILNQPWGPPWTYFPTWYSKSGHFPIEIPIKNKKW